MTPPFSRTVSFIPGRRPRRSRERRGMTSWYLVESVALSIVLPEYYRSYFRKSTSILGYARLLPHQRAAALVERAERLIARDRRDDLGQVPFTLRLLGRLRLHQIHVADHPAVHADAAVPGHEVVDRHLLHLRLRGLRLQQIGREVCRVQRMPG